MKARLRALTSHVRQLSIKEAASKKPSDENAIIKQIIRSPSPSNTLIYARSDNSFSSSSQQRYTQHHL